MNHVTNISKAQDVVIIARFLSAKYFPAFTIDINDVTEESVPIRMFIERACDFAQGVWSITIIAVENRDDVSGSALYALVHRVIMAAVLFRDPLQSRIAA